MDIFKTKEEMFSTLNTWDCSTYSEDFNRKTKDPSYGSDESLELLKYVLKVQKLNNKKMNGFSVQSLKKAEFERMGLSYVSIFNKLEESDVFWTPLDILNEVCKHTLGKKTFYTKKAMKYGYPFEQITALMCGRALRALPSYIREYQLKNALKTTFNSAIFSQSAELDMRCHCDIKMDFNNKEYFFWSFVNSTRSIYQFVDKFSGNRHGTIPDGTHVLCPINVLSGVIYKGWSFYSQEYVNQIYDAVMNEHEKYNDVKNGLMFSPNFYKNPIAIDKQLDDLKPSLAV